MDFISSVTHKNWSIESNGRLTLVQFCFWILQDVARDAGFIGPCFDVLLEIVQQVT